jgi:type II secretory pathway component PulK
MSNSHRKRLGMTLILVMTCLAIASALLVTGVKLAVTSHRLTRSFSWTVQARWLAESGIERAAAKLAADENYSGETWTIPAEILGGENAGQVKIDIQAVPDRKNSRLVKALAIFPDDPNDRVQYTKELTLELL